MKKAIIHFLCSTIALFVAFLALVANYSIAYNTINVGLYIFAITYSIVSIIAGIIYLIKPRHYK